MKLNFEPFPPVNKESLEKPIEKTDSSNELSSLSNIKGILNKTKEFLKSKSVDLRLGAMVLVTMGSMEVVQAQEGDMSKFRDAINDIQSGKYNTTQITDSVYNSYKLENNDSAYFVQEINSYHKDGKIVNEDITYSGQNLQIEDISDTISFGDVDVKKYTVHVLESGNNLDNDKQGLTENENFQFFSGIKINIEGDNSITREEKSSIGYGDNINEAIVSAITEVVSLRSCYVKAMSSIKMESESVSSETTKSYKEKESFVDLSTVESHDILKNVKVLVKKIQPNKYRRHFGLSRKNAEVPKDYYSVEVMYSE